MAKPKIVYALAAERDLDQLFDWIADDSSPQRARAVLTRIEQTIAMIAGLPGMGRVRHDLDDQTRSFAVFPWIVIYEPLPEGKGIAVLRVVDGRRDLPRVLD